MRTNRRGTEVVLLIISGLSSAAMSAFGLMAGAWGGFWRGSSSGDASLGLLFWLLPTLSLVTFALYFLSRSSGLLCSWAILIGSAITIYCVNLKSCLAGQCTTTNPVKIALGVFLLPHIWILSAASIALYLATVLGSKSAVGTDDTESSAG
jgi:hypothetical protein